jgi:MYXO-CTERM domain-containing protein
LDSDTAAFVLCNNTGTSTPTFTGLAEGPHTLDVRARDDASDAGNVSSGTVRWSWTVHSLDAGDDGGDDDAGDAGTVDAPSVDALLFADASDADEETDTAGTVVLDARADTSRDAFVAADRARDTVVSLRDVADDDSGEAGVGVLDAASDATDAIGSGDAGPSIDSAKLDAILASDTAVAPSPDASVSSPDTAKPIVKLDAAPDGVKLMGGGFCSVNPSGTGTPGLATLFLVAAFGLLIVRRRRR